jgi:predicted GNAT superfamily acetyltransferase
MDELDACVALQQRVWGYSDLEVMPRKVFLLAQELCGQVIGAFEPDGTMVGFAMALPAIDPEAHTVYLHSHMLAVLPGFRNSGLGRRLKLAQREDALARGIVKMTWTFDPLQPKNAYLNLHRLGAIARRYSPDFYGVSSSRLQGDLPTDRLHAEWWLQSAHVRARLTSSQQHASGARSVDAAERILLPHDAEQWKSSEETLGTAREVQSANRELFLDAFARGLAVTDFSRDAEGNGVFELRTWHQTEDAL